MNITRSTYVMAMAMLASGVSAAPAVPGCWEQLEPSFAVIEETENLPALKAEGARLLMIPETLRLPGGFIAEIKGSEAAELQILRPGWMCRFIVDAGDCTQVGEVVDALREFRPQVASTYGIEPTHIHLHATRYQVELNLGFQAASLSQYGPDDQPIRALVEDARTRLSKCLPEEVNTYLRNEMEEREARLRSASDTP